MPQPVFSGLPALTISNVCLPMVISILPDLPLNTVSPYPSGVGNTISWAAIP